MVMPDKKQKQKKKHGIGRKIGSIFMTYADDEDELEDELTDEEIAELENSPVEAPAESSTPVETETESDEEDDEIDPDILNSITNHLKENALESYDYMQFMDLIEGEEGKESRIYKMAFKMSAKMGADADSILNSVDYYIDLLVKHREEKMGQLEAAEKDSVDILREQSVGIDAKVAEKEKLLEQTQDEIEALKQERSDLDKEANDTELELTRMGQHANLAYRHVFGELEHNKAKIAKYIQ